LTDVLPRLTEALADRYRLERELGQGGMATVYLAQDIRHNRRVAVKVLRPELAAVIGAERFLSEITTTANLQHPHILPLFDSGEADGFLFYVMPYVEGETVRDRISREKQLPVDDAVRITVEVASALDYAHRHGVIHRDIKPENILLHDGAALVADFGIALAVSTAGSRMTETGMSLGTPHYMSPEQAMGEREITATSDVYALGCVLYEMLVGEPPFTGPTAQAIIARVVTEEPRSLTVQRKTIPPQVEGAVRQALQKLPADRFKTAADFADALQGRGSVASYAGTAAQGSHAGARAGTYGGWRARIRDPLVIVPALIAVAALAVAASVAKRAVPAAIPPIRYVLAASDSTQPLPAYPWPAAISPDGGTVVYTVAQDANTVRLYALRTDQLEPHPIPGTTDAFEPHFSPDGRWLAFGQDDKERKVRLDGSAPVTIATAGAANGAVWTARDQIVLGSYGATHGLSYVSAAGGEPVALTQPDTANGKTDHIWPIALPDGKSVIFVIWSGSLSTSELAITFLDDGRTVPLGIQGIRPLAVLDGLLVYVQADGTIMAVKLDPRGRKLAGRPIPVHDPVTVASANNGNSGVFISPGGALVTSRGGARGTLDWVSPGGQTEPLLKQPGAYQMPRLSPDGQRVAVVVYDGRQSDVWIYDRTLSTFSKLTTSGTVTSVNWSADGRHILFTASGEEARGAVWWQLAAGGSPAEKLTQNIYLTPDAAVSPDEKSLLVTSLRETSWDLLRVPLDSGGVARSYLNSPALEGSARFSPDGKWVALTSNESGRFEVYVRSFPDPSSKVQVSVAGGGEPTWSADGRRLYYRSGSSLLAARISLTPTFTLLGRDTILTNAHIAGTTFFGANYDVTRDGKRVLAVLSGADDFQLVISPNWITEFRQRVAESSGGSK
jgi:Tol biopolymer transport system component/tRNA A-37 threonylcarbamoyl transferase component Bud32